jgi:hypothetical protein
LQRQGEEDRGGEAFVDEVIVGNERVAHFFG